MKNIAKQILVAALVLSFLSIGFPIAHAAKDLSWSKNIDDMTVNLSSVTYGNDSFVAVGEDGIIKTSSDGYQWICRTSGTKGNLLNVSWCKDRFFALGSSGLILSSTDGITWTKQTPPTKYGLSDAIIN